MTAAIATPAPHTDAALEDARKRLLGVAQTLSSSLAARGELLADLTACAVAGEHAVLLGPPGTAKSLVARAFARALAPSDQAPDSYFEYLLTPFTEPNELFGPVDIEAFKRGEYRRVVEGMLPSANLAFLDEAFKANSAILNSLLTILNERLYHEGKNVRRVPLQMAILASNELPAAGLQALWDRCLVRHQVSSLTDVDQIGALFDGSMTPLPEAPLSSWEDALALRELLASVTVPAAVTKALVELHAKLGAKGVVVSDRRKVQEGRWLRAVTVLDGRTSVSLESFDRLSPVLWTRYEDRATIDLLIEPYAAAWKSTARQVSAAFTETHKGLEAAMKAKDLQRAQALAADLKAQLAQVSQYSAQPGVAGLIAQIKSAQAALKDFAIKAYGG